MSKEIPLDIMVDHFPRPTPYRLIQTIPATAHLLVLQQQYLQIFYLDLILADRQYLPHIHI